MKHCFHTTLHGLAQCTGSPWRHHLGRPCPLLELPETNFEIWKYSSFWIWKKKGYFDLSFRMFTFSLILFLPWPWYRASLLQNNGTEGWNVHMFTSTNFHFDVDIPQVTSALGRSGRLCMRCWQHAQMGGPLPPYGHPWLWSWWWDDVGENAKWCAGCWWLWTTTRCGWLLTFIFGHPWSWWRGEGYKHIALLQVMFDDEKVTRLMIFCLV